MVFATGLVHVTSRSRICSLKVSILTVMLYVTVGYGRHTGSIGAGQAVEEPPRLQDKVSKSAIVDGSF